MRKPGILAWEPFAAGEHKTADSLEGLLRHPLNVSATFDEDYGNPRRGQIVYEAADGLMKPFVVAEVENVLAAGRYEVEFYGAVEPGDTVLVFEADSETGVEALVTGVTQATTTERGLVHGEYTLSLEFDEGAEPAAPVLILYSEAVSETPAGVVYESTLDTDFALSVEVDGARLSSIAGSGTAFVQSLPGFQLRSNLLFIRTV